MARAAGLSFYPGFGPLLEIHASRDTTASPEPILATLTGGRRLFGWYLGTVLKAVEKQNGR